MFRSKSVLVTSIFGLSALVLGSCSSSGPVVLSLRSTQERSGANAANPKMSAEIADSRLAYGYDISYKVASDLPDLGKEGKAWSVTPMKDNRATLKKLATGFGIAGEVVKVDKNSFSIGQDDKTGTGLWLYVDVSSAWWSYSSAAQMGGGTISSPTCAPDATKTECVISGEPVAPPAPPKNLPDAAAATARVSQILKDANLKVNSYSLSATTSTWSTDVVGILKAGNVASNISMMFSFGADGVITYASGPLVELTDAGAYPLISPTAAVKRLSQMQYGLVGPTARSAVDTAVSSPPVEGSEPQTVEVPITGVRLGLMQSTLTNNSSILLPAYTFTNADGDVGTVMAVEDKYFSFGESEVTEGSEPVPVPVDPGAGGGSTGGSTGADSGPAVSPINPVALLDDAAAKKLLGLSEDEAQKVATESGWTVRIANRDGEAFMLTTDFQTNRVNLTVTKGSVTAVTIG
ncbi:MAG: hypothetical protein F2930_03710 [Actinobacteria bacterium]|uniref:Unannotated protein n=1 Tax=freshwater metagenome TaxID=449393 RepID=A0A6J7T6A1_9ZZZZ|nr:hypothetical protein [Actinomycetota bacterium]